MAIMEVAMIVHKSFYTGQCPEWGARWAKRSVSDGSASFLLFVRVVLPESSQEGQSGRSPGGWHKNLLQSALSLCRMVLRGVERPAAPPY
jgi:hypothetical protein